MKKGKVLIVDDNSTIRTMARRTLEGADFEVIEAQNGALGVEQAQANELDLVLADINMPVMNGLDMIRNIRKLGKHAKTPILILSTENTKTMLQESKVAGANGWMVKPFDRDKLLQVLDRVLSRAC